MTSARMEPLITALNKMLTSAIELAKRKAPTAKMSDNADTLQSKTIAEHRDLYNTETVFPHTDRTNNPHGVTPEQANGYSMSQANDLIATTIGADESPIFSFGAPNDYPLDVSGSFDGSLRLMTKRNMALCYEEDGTLSILRNGTDGGTTGVFLAYVPDMATANPMKPVFTNQRYQAGYWPEGYRATYICQGGQGIICGVIEGPGPKLYFISIMDGTISGVAHRGVLIDPAVGNDNFLENSEMVLLPDGVLMLSRQFVGAGGTMALLPGFIPIRDFRYDPPSPISIFYVPPTTTGTDLYGTARNTQLIYFADRCFGRALSDKPFCMLEDSRLSVQFNYADGNVRTRSAYDPVSGKVLITMLGIMRATLGGVASAGASPSYYAAMELEVTENGTKYNYQCVAGKSVGNDPPLILGVSNITINERGPALTSNMGSLMVGSSILDRSFNWAIDGKGGVFYYLDDYYNFRADSFVRQVIQTSQWVPVGNPTAPIRPLTTTRVQASVSKFPPLPSALGSNIGPAVLTPWGYITYGFGRDKNGETTTGLIRFAVGTPPGFPPGGAGSFSYPSINWGSYLGWAPSVQRDVVSDVYPDLDFRGIVTTTRSSNANAVFSAAAVLSEGFRYSGGGQIEANGSFIPASYNTTPTALAQLKQSLFERMGKPTFLSGAVDMVPIVGLGVGGSYILAVMLFVDLDAQMKMVVARLFGTPGAPIITDVSEPFSIGASNGLSAMASGGTMLQCNYQIREMSDGQLAVIGRHSSGFGTAGSMNTVDVRFVLDSSAVPVVNTLRAILRGTSTNTKGQMYIPGWGFCEIMSSTEESDFQSKLVLAPVGDTAAALTAWNVNTNKTTWRVLAGLQVASQWTFSFNQYEPCVRRGKYFSIPPATLNLQDVDPAPANKTFYVYVKPVSLTYAAYTSLQTEGADTLFLGTVNTGQTQITALNLEKVVGFGAYRLSTRPSGGAIPVSGGLPSRPGTLLWK